MKIQRIALALAALAACGAASAQQAFVNQQGTNDSVSIEQTTPAGSSTSATVSQVGGSFNSVSVLQAPLGPAPGSVSATASVSQQATTGASAGLVQLGVTASSMQLTQSYGSGAHADLFQAGVANSRIIVDQAASGQDALVQQTNGTNNGYVRTGQGIGANTLVVLQGQPAGGVTDSQARVIQNGNGNDAHTVQSAGSNLAAYTAQGLNSTPGYYYSNAAGGYVEVDRNVPPVFTYDSHANITQSGNGNGSYILQYGSALNGYVTQSGQGNFAGILQTGSANTASASQGGVQGSITIAQRGTGGYTSVTQFGSGNTATVNQR